MDGSQPPEAGIGQPVGKCLALSAKKDCHGRTPCFFGGPETRRDPLDSSPALQGLDFTPVVLAKPLGTFVCDML
ncbi:hypothetical protein GCM10023069_34650 [Shinella granuli]